MMAFDTRYDVRIHVDSSALADKLPEMCGNATFAIEVSSTSINVASVTVTAITQGLIEPSGIRNFDRNLSFTLRLEILSSLAGFLCVKSRSSVRERCRHHVHSRSQNRLLWRNRIENDFYRHALYDLHVISRGVFRRQQTQHRASRSSDRINMTRKSLAVSVHFHFHLLARLHRAQLRFLKIRSDPNILQRHDDH